ncbi:MAG: hypothetical protein IJF33_02710 [Clostridia bacterium]|nr:hypothetical protein [Clostridia bacterium]
MKKEQNTTFIAPSTPQKASVAKNPPPPKATLGEAKPVSAPSVKKQTAGVSLPRTARTGTAKKGTAPTFRKKASATATAPSSGAPRAEDESLEEVLDEATDTAEIAEEIPYEEPEILAEPPKKASIFQRRRQQQEQLAEQTMSAMEIIQKRSGLSEDDIALIFELGYENELGRLVGYETLKRLKNEHARKLAKQEGKSYCTAFGYRGEELVGSKHKEAVTAAYVHDRKQLIARTVFTALLALVLLLLDMPSLWAQVSTDITANLPLLFPLLAASIFALTALLSLQQIRAGWRSLFHFTPTPYSVCAVLPPLVLLYDLASFFTSAPMLQINFLASLFFLLTALCDVLRLSGEMRMLSLLQTSAPKYVLAEAKAPKKKLRRGEKIVKIIHDDLDENVYRVSVCKDAAGFFRRVNKMSAATVPFTVFLITALTLSVFLGFATAIRTASLASALSTAAGTLMISLPGSALLFFFYPLTRANRLLTYHNCALLGEESAEEYSEQKTVIFSDTDLFTAQKHAEISVREGVDLRSDIVLANVLFRKLGGTLGMAAPPAPALKPDPPVSILRVQENGVEAIVDNRRHLLLGDVAFLGKSGIRVPTESTDRELRRTENTARLYFAVDGMLKLSYEIEYQIKPHFEELIRALSDSNTAVAIHTCDPNLNNEFLQVCRSDEPEPVKVAKPGRFEEEKPLELADTGALALGSATDLVYPLHAAHRIALLRRFGFRIQLIASLVGSAMLFLFAMFGKQDLFGILPIALYQGFWVLVSLISTRSELCRQTLSLPSKKQIEK